MNAHPPQAASQPLVRTLSADLLASLVVFLVALPLCVAIAQTCGYPPEAGVITGIIGGILVGVLAGSPLQVSGPAAGLIVLVADVVREDGGMARLGWIVLIAGALQILAGVFRLGQWFRAVSPGVVLGMLAGIGVIILAKQAHVLFDTKAPNAILDSITAIPHTIQTAAGEGWPGKLSAGVIGGVAVVAMFVWKPLVPKRVRVIPAAVVAVLAAVLLAELTGWPVAKLSVSGLGNGVRLLDVAGWEVLKDGKTWVSAVTVAAVASAESLLCAAAVDSKHSGPRTQFNRELIAQGVGNMLCGVLGVLPMTGVIVRSAANVDAGAKTRLSAVLHGMWLLLFVALLPGVLARVPVAALAGVLVYTGWKLLEVPEAVKLFRLSRGAFVVYLVTAAVVVAEDLLTGVLVGIGLTAVRLFWMLSRVNVRVVDEPDHRRLQVHLEGAGTFVALPKLASELASLPPGRHVHLNLDGLRFVDHAVFELLSNFQGQYATTGGVVYLDVAHLTARFHTTQPVGVGEVGTGNETGRERTGSSPAARG
jgi:MFS superfamily sulfate permease-like transporter